jgi:hypothetical protein
MTLGSGTQTDEEFLTDVATRQRPWTATDYIRLHKAAQALVKTHTSVDLAGKRVMAAFDGHAYWELLGALDRTGTN